MRVVSTKGTSASPRLLTSSARRRTIDVSSATEVYGLMLTTMSRPDEGELHEELVDLRRVDHPQKPQHSTAVSAQNRFATPFLSKRARSAVCLHTLFSR